MKYDLGITSFTHFTHPAMINHLKTLQHHTSSALASVRDTVNGITDVVVDLSHRASHIMHEAEDTAKLMVDVATDLSHAAQDKVRSASHTAQKRASSVMYGVRDAVVNVKDAVVGLNEAVSEALGEAAWIRISKVMSHNFPTKDTSIEHRDIEIDEDEVMMGAGLYAQYAQAIYPDEGMFATDPSSDDQLTIVTDDILPAEDNPGLYRCAIVINHKEKKVTFVVAGTRFDSTKAMIADLLDDARLGLGLLPKKVEAARKLNDYFLRDFAREHNIAEWKFITTGHSLGAAVAHAAAADLACKIYCADPELLRPGMISTKTFENPGSKTLVTKIVEMNARYGSDITVNEIMKNVQFLSFNNSKSLLHIPGQEIGTVFHIHHNESPLTQKVEKTLARFGSSTLAEFMRQMTLHKIGHIKNAIDDTTLALILPSTGRFVDQKC